MIGNIKYKFSQLNIVEKLILINVFFFIIPFFFKTFFFLFQIPIKLFLGYFELSSEPQYLILRPWTLFSYSFFHGSFQHLLWNMILLYYAGNRLFLNLFSAQKFINVYFLGVLLGGLFFIVSYQLFPAFSNTSPAMIGASAGVMAILVFVSTYVPNQKVSFIVFNISLKYIGIALVIMDILQIPNGNAGGHLAHLGGAFLGYFYAQQLKKGKDIGKGFENLWKYIFIRQKKERKTTQNTKKTEKKSPPKDIGHQQKIDAILDKISKNGYESLTKEEKQYLFNASKK